MADLYRVFLAVDDDLSLTTTLGLQFAEHDGEAIDTVERAYWPMTPADLATLFGWSPLADGEDNGPFMTAEALVYRDVPPHVALERLVMALVDIRALQGLDDHTIEVMARAMLASLGVDTT